MPSSSRALPGMGVAFVLVLLLAAPALVHARAAAQSRNASTPRTASGPVHFIWTTTRFNSSGGCTTIHSQFTDEQPQVLLFVTPHWANDPHPIYIAYSSGLLWIICHADRAPMPVGAEFNVLVVPHENSAAFTTPVPPYVERDYQISSPLSNGKPDAMILVTQNVTPGGTDPASPLDPSNLSVAYDYVNNWWTIHNEDDSPVPYESRFNVLIGTDSSGGGSEFLLTATSSNTSGNTVALNNALTNGNGNASLFVTQSWRPNGAINNNALGVSYGCISGLWCVYNQQVTNTIPLSAVFNVLVFPS